LIVTGGAATAATAGATERPAASRPAASARPAGAPIISATRCAANRAAGTITFVSPFGYDASAGIIDVVDAAALGYFSDLCLDVKIEVPSFALSPDLLVSSGKGTVTGEGSAADDLVKVANGDNLVAVATFGDTSDYALLTRPDITKLSELDHKLLGYHTTLPVVLTEMLHKAGATAVDEVNDNSYDPTVLFAAKPGYSALQAYQSNEPLELEAAGYKLGPAFREWTPAQFGVKGTFNVQVMNGTFLHDHPAAAADFFRAELHATAYCLAHETSCVDIEQDAAKKARYDNSLPHEQAEWAYEAGLIRKNSLPGRGVGVETAAEWAPELAAVESYKLVTHAPRLATVENTSLVASLYTGTTLNWPGN
jgi:NitT/TauT family transport system substrate-binding protein